MPGQGLGDSRDRDLGPGGSLNGGSGTHGTGASTRGLTQRGLGPGGSWDGVLVIKLRKLCSFVSTNGTFHTLNDNYLTLKIFLNDFKLV